MRTNNNLTLEWKLGGAMEGGAAAAKNLRRSPPRQARHPELPA